MKRTLLFILLGLSFTSHAFDLKKNYPIEESQVVSLKILDSQSHSSNNQGLKKQCRLTKTKGGVLAVACDVDINTNEVVSFTIKNTSSTAYALNIRAKLPASWTDASQDASACQQLAPGQTCQLNIQSGGFARARSEFPIVGDNTPAIKVAITINATELAYIVSMDSNNVTRCAVQPDGTLAFCIIAASGFNSPNDIFFTPDNSFAYVTNSNSISKCPVSANGTLGACTQASNRSDTVRGAVNPAGTNAFLSDFVNDDIVDCDIDGNNNLINCSVTPVALNNPDGITFTASGTRSYVAENNNQVSRCNAGITNCPNTFAFTFPTTVTLNSAEDIAYIVEIAGTVQACDIDGLGDLNNCNQSNIPGPTITSLALNIANDRAFITDSTNDNILSCQITNLGKTLSNCSSTGSLLDDPVSIRIRDFS